MSIPTLLAFVRDHSDQLSNEHLILYLLLRGRVAAHGPGTVSWDYHMRTGRTATFIDVDKLGMGDQGDLSLTRLDQLGWIKRVAYEGQHGIELADENGNWHAYQLPVSTLDKIRASMAREDTKLQAPETPRKVHAISKDTPATIFLESSQSPVPVLPANL